MPASRPSGLVGSRAAQLAAVAIAVIAAAAVEWQNDGLWFQGDAPRHVANGLFLLDLARALPAQPIDYALSYYARYPIIVPVAYPPLFYFLEAAAFTITGPNPLVAKALVWGFAAMTAIYTMAWARRRISPIAGWAGATVVLMPAMLQYSNAVLLNVPSTAFCVAALYHFQQWLDHNTAPDRRWFLLFTTAALLTYYPSAIILPIAVVWMLASKPAMLRSRAIWVVFGVLVVLLVIVNYTLPLFSNRMSPTLSRWQNPAAWRLTIRNVVRVIDVRWLPIAAVAIMAGLARGRYRSEAIRLAVVFPVVLVVLVVIPAEDNRYALVLAPIAALTVWLGLSALVERSGRWQRIVASAGVVAILSWSVWVAQGTTIPEASGFREIAAFVTAEGPADSILYSGNHDGIFGLYLRMMDPGFDRRLVVSNRLLYGLAQGELFGWQETPHVTSAADVVSMIQHQSGCRWVAVEVGGRLRRPASEQYLEQALEGSEFEHVRSFPVQTIFGVTAVELYRFRGTLDVPPPMDLQFPSFSPQIFPRVVPIER